MYFLPTHLHTYRHKLKFLIHLKKCDVTYLNYAKWQILIKLDGNMWVDYILITKMGIVYKWLMDETIYGAHIHYPCGMYWHYSES